VAVVILTSVKRAAVALARKLAVVLHAIWKAETDSDPAAVTVAA
jgi:hypothetical protein